MTSPFLMAQRLLNVEEYVAGRVVLRRLTQRVDLFTMLVVQIGISCMEANLQSVNARPTVLLGRLMLDSLAYALCRHCGARQEAACRSIRTALNGQHSVGMPMPLAFFFLS